MTEGLFSRVTRLVTGGVNGLVDKMENAAPESVMREAIREVDDAADDVRDELGRAIANRHHANKRLMETTSKHEELAEKATLALDQNRDDLAEAAINRQLDLEAQIPVLETALKDMVEKQSELEGYVSALVARKREMESDLASFAETRQSTQPGANSAAGPAQAHGLRAEGLADKAESAFNRVLHDTSGIAATVRADGETAAKLAELEKVTQRHRVQERLATLKATRD